MTYVEFTVNGQKCTVDNHFHFETSLNSYLRFHLGLTGAKTMCTQGVCGVCIVNVTARRHTTGLIETFSVNSCVTLVFSCHGWEITTIEGVGDRLQGYNDVQKRIAGFNATQCGFCTPGWMMHLNSLKDKGLTMLELENSFGCNTCRCTGYRPILDTFKSFAIDSSPCLSKRVKDIEDLPYCFKDKAKICDRRCSDSSDSDWSLITDKTNDMIMLNFGEKIFFKVYEEDQIFSLFKTYGTESYMLIDGNTGKGIIDNFEYPSIVIDISDVASLKKYYYDQNLVLGANVPLQDCMTIFRKSASSMCGFAYLNEFAKHFDLIAQIPIRTLGSLAGNMMLKYKISTYHSDVYILLETVGAIVTTCDCNGTKTKYTISQFLKTDMQGKLIVSFDLPPKGSNYIFRSYKIMPRSQNSLSIINAGFSVSIDFNTNTIESAKIVYGNISSVFIHALKTEDYLKGRNVFTNRVLQGAMDVLGSEIVPVENSPEPSPSTRKKLSMGLFYKFVLSLSPKYILSSRYESGGSLIVRPVSSGLQSFQTNPSLYPLNQPLMKLEALIQSSGEARYVNDLQMYPNELFCAFVLSTRHNGEVDEINVADALKLEGVVALFRAKDIPGKNSFTCPGIQLQTEDEEILADKNIKYYGQPIAIIVAVSQELAVRAADEVKVTYKNYDNTLPILTISEAKKYNDRIMGGNEIKATGKGDNVKKVIKGVFEAGAQYHFYMEPLSCVVVPSDQRLEVYDSTQWMDLTQIAVARCLNMNECNVHVEVRRLGGAFGGKISRNSQVACACAIAAKALNRPCRFVLPLKTNMAIAGKRLPFQCEYEAGVDDVGKIQYLNAVITEDDGCCHNENILTYVGEAFPNCYNSQYFNLKTYAVRTDLPSNTFARAPGTLEGIACIENIMEHIAFAVQKDPTEVRLANMRTDDNDIPVLIKTLKEKADYDKRLKEIKKFNKNNRWMKKAITINVMRFPVVYYGNYSASISVFRGDGTVTLTSGGIEMGQGVNTKAVQVCAYELGIPVEHISVEPSYSFVAANNVFSGSSIVSESVCYAIIKACDTLKQRLKPIRDQMDNPTWLQLIQKAGEEEIDLNVSFMTTDKEADLEGYSAFAVSMLEAKLDVLTGKFELSRCDILEDVGLSANPNIDIGQIEGAYVFALSYLTFENLVYDKQTGKMLTNNALKYEVYLAKDIPVDFRIYIRYNSKNTKGVLGSKSVGEMGACSSHGVIYALRRCIAESRKDSGYDPTLWFDLDIPLTTESILKALDVKPSEFLLS